VPFAIGMKDDSPFVFAVSMNITTLATSLASSKLPASFASFNFSS
jgi:hypothetical protein